VKTATLAADAVLGAHLISNLEAGRVDVLDGPVSAAADVFSARVLGRGGHAAFPHLVVDPIPIAAQAISSLQQIVSRNTKPLDSVVVSGTRVHGGTADNVVPEAVELGGTTRTYGQEVREQTRAAMERILAGVTGAHGGAYEFDYVPGYDSVVNDGKLAALVRAPAGPDRLIEIEPMMAGEDFSAYLRAAPGCFFLVGAGGQDAFPHHHPRFTIDDETALPVAIDTMTRAALAYLGL
jgi:amidohydrolase